MNTWQKWLHPRRDWHGRRALVPLDTCYRILELYSWGFAILATIAFAFVGIPDAHLVIQLPSFWIMLAALALQWLAVLLRGLPFLVRYGLFAGNLVVFLVSTVTVMAITPNWSFLVIMLLSSAGLLFGTAVGLWASAGLLAIHVVLAWGWVQGYLPLGPAGAPPMAAFSDFRSPVVWMRVLTVNGGMFVVLQLVMRYVLRDMNRALGDANTALRQLTAEQERRTRSELEITRLNAELEVRVRDRTAELALRVAEVERLNAEQQTLMGELRASQSSADRAAARLQEVNSNLIAANQELEAFSYSVSHDLRAPLRNLTGFLDLLNRRAAAGLDPESARYVAVAAAEAQRMGLLIDDLLTFSRIGRTELQLQPVDLGALVAEVRAALAADLGDRVVEWQVEPLPAVHGDAALLRQVVANVLANAVKFTRRCPVARIEIGASAPARGEGRIAVFVRDNGAGFNPRYLDKLFGVFQRLHNSRDFEGTGIGLANVKRIVTRHGGRVWAEGQVDRGATFYFTLPLAVT